MQAVRAAYMALPAAPYDACHKVVTRPSSVSLVRSRNNDCSVPTRYGHQEVLAKGYVDRVAIACRGETIAVHFRSYETGGFASSRVQYLALLELKSRALVQAPLLNGWQLGVCVHRLLRLMDARMGNPGPRKFNQKLRLRSNFHQHQREQAVTEALRLFEVFSQRYQRGAILGTSNLPFDEWTSAVGSERLTGALLDQLTYPIHILEMNSESFRLANSKKAQRRSIQGHNAPMK